MESVSGSDVRLRRVGAVGLRRVGAVGLGTGQDKSSRAGGADGAMAQGMAHHCQAPHGHGIATSKVNMGIIVKFSEALPCVKSPVSRTAGTIYVVREWKTF